MATLASLVVRLVADTREFETGMARATTATTAIARNTDQAAAQLGKFRSATVAVANAAAGSNPIFSQTATILGSMAASTGPIAAAIAGVTALGFAWSKLTEDTRAAAKEQEEAIGRLGKLLEKQQQGIFGTTKQDINQAQAKMDELLGKMNDARQRIADADPFAKTVSRDFQTIFALNKEYLELKKMVVAGQAQVGDTLADDLKKGADAATAAAEKFKRLREEVQKLGEEWEMLNSQIATGAQLHARDVLGTFRNLQGIARVPAVTGMPRQVGLIGTSQWEIDAMRRERMGSGQSIAQSVGDSIKRMLDPRMILSGLATGGISTLLGGITDTISGFLDAGKAAREMAKALRLAREAAAKSVNEWLGGLNARLGSPAQQESFNAAERVRDMFNQFAGALGLNHPMPQLPSLDAVIQWIRDMLNAPAQLRAEDRETLRKILEGAELEKKLLEMADAVSQTSEALRNVPTGFKVALARFNVSDASTGNTATVIGPVGTAGRSITITGNVTVVANDPNQFIDQMQRRQFRSTGSIALPRKS